MSRLQSLLRKAEEGRLVEALNGRTNANRVQALADLQARFDHLAGVAPWGQSSSES
jgi:polyphosphate kinase